MVQKIALFPEASFGAALNCVGIAQALRAKGAQPVFICHSGFSGVFADYGFAEYHLPPADRSGSAGQEEDYWQAFLGRHLPHFSLSAADQIETYVAPTWDAIVDSVVAAERPLRQLLAKLQPDAIVLDNVAMFPAIATAGCPWIRMISCAETELGDPQVPPYLSGLAAGDRAGAEAFRKRYVTATKPAHLRMNALRDASGLPPLAAGEFLEPSPYLNLLLTPDILKRDRANPLDPALYCYLPGCVRVEPAYTLPGFPGASGPLVYVSFGSLGALDIALIKRVLQVLARLPARFLVNVGGYRDAYEAVPDNVHLAAWFPQPSVLEQADLFIHHGGNNSLCEALLFGVPSLILPYCWDGHDNARRVVEIGAGQGIAREGWTDEMLEREIRSLLADSAMRARLRTNAAQMGRTAGPEIASDRILAVAASAQDQSNRTGPAPSVCG